MELTERQSAADSGDWRQWAVVSSAPPIAASLGPEAISSAVPLELAELRAKVAGLERERETLASSINTLTAQLAVRTEELRRRDAAEEQLRVMLMRREHTHAVLAGALVQKSLPPAPAEGEQPKRLRWWAP